MLFASSLSRTILKNKLMKPVEFALFLSQLKHTYNNNNTLPLQSKHFFCTSTATSPSITQQPSLTTQQPSSSSFPLPYTQRATTPTHMSHLLIASLPDTPPLTILHQLSLYSNKLLPFDYDYYCESLKRLIPHQDQLSLQELLMVLDLAIEYKIDNVVIRSHFVNQLYCRVYLGLKKEVAEYDRQVNKKLEMTYKTLENGSGDHFGVVEERFKEELDKEEGEEMEEHDAQGQAANTAQTNSKPSSKITSLPIYNASQRKNRSKNITPSTLTHITQIFLALTPTNIDFNRLLLQVSTIRLDQHTSPTLQEMSPEFLLTYTRLTTTLLQSYMAQYHAALEQATNKQSAKYTHRSVKRIYKLQAFYYYEVAKLVEEKKLLEGATEQQFKTFVGLIAGFPIRRRSFRKAIGDVLIGESKRRGLEVDGLMGFFELSRFDNQLLKHFEEQVNGGKQLPTSSQAQPQAITSSSNSPLIPQIVLDQSHPQSDTEGLFKMPVSLFRKVTKKKSKPKKHHSKDNSQQEVQIDLTQVEEQESIESTETVQNEKDSSKGNKQ